MKSERSVMGQRAATARFWFAGLGLTALVYLAVFVATREDTPLGHAQAVLRNLTSLALAVAAARAMIARYFLRLTGPALWLAHAALAIAFSLAWFWLLTLAAAILDAGSATRFSVAPYLFGPSAVWQLLQGLFAYVAVAALTVLEHRPTGGGIIAIDRAALSADRRFLLRDGEDIVTISATNIVCITGADDYAELVTTDGTHLVATTLTEFEALFADSRFVRVHRSAIANLDHLMRAEPVGGGRMILRMATGPDLPVSRSGARLLREQAL